MNPRKEATPENKAKETWRSFWDKQRQQFLKDPTDLRTLFPIMGCFNGVSWATRGAWADEVMELLGTDRQILKQEVPLMHYRYWGLRSDGTVGWLGGADFLEDTDLPFDQLVPGMVAADYQHGWCPGIRASIAALTGGREAIMITNLGIQPTS